MSEKWAKLLKEDDEDDRTVEEILEDQHQRNKEIDWDICTMVPEVCAHHQNSLVRADDD